MKIKTWNIEALTGYKPFTTFYEDFSIADAFGVNAIKDTYKLAFKAWKHDYKYITEFIMALNWKIHEHYGHNDAYAEDTTNCGVQQTSGQWKTLRVKRCSII